MKFVNDSEAVQVRQSDGPGRFKWKLLHKGETIELPEGVGKAYGFKKVTEGQAGTKKVETKQFEAPDFFKEICSIKGIGIKTAKDIVRVFLTKKDLIKAISHDDELPFRDDVEKLLRSKYGK